MKRKASWGRPGRSSWMTNRCKTKEMGCVVVQRNGTLYLCPDFNVCLYLEILSMFRGRLIFIDPALFKYLAHRLVSLLVLSGLVPDVITLLITNCCSNGDNMVAHKMAPSINTKVSNLSNDGRAGMSRRSLGELKEKCERRTAPALCVKMCLYCLWHFHINGYHNEQLFKVVWHSNLSVCATVVVHLYYCECTVY